MNRLPPRMISLRLQLGKEKRLQALWAIPVFLSSAKKSLGPDESRQCFLV